jgi:Tfp pilus assembly protein PilN
LFYDRIDIAAVKNGRVTKARRLSVDLPMQANEWVVAVKEAGAKLKPIVEEFKLGGARTAVFYRSPTQAVDLTSYELRSTAEACNAAMLTCTDALPYASASAICRALPVGRDRSGQKPKTHVVVAADRTDVIRAIVEMVQSAGLTVDSLTPLEAVILAKHLQRSLRRGTGHHGSLHFGENTSFFVVCGGGAVRFERTIGIGLRTIAQGLTRPIRLPGGDESVELDSESARKILHEHGIPDSDEVVHENPSLTRRHIMPLIQPVLQRFIIELRQSLRFGIPNEEERKSIAVTVAGPGSCIPGFTGLLGWELRIDVKPDESYAGYDYRKPASPGGELVDVLGDPKTAARLNLMPGELTQRRTVERVRRSLWAGTAAALVVLGADWTRYQSTLGAVEQESEVLANAAAAIEQMEKTQEQLVAAIGSMNHLQGRLNEEIGSEARPQSFLKELSLLTPKSVRLSTITFKREPDGLKGRATGRALPIRPPDLQTELQGYVDQLKASPLLQDVELLNVTADPMGPEAGQRFDVSFIVLFGPEPAERSAGNEEGRP